jgi:HEAT repeat protein
MLLDAYFEEKNSVYRSKFRLIIPVLRRGIVKEVIDRFEYCEPHLAKDLFDIIRLCSEKKAHLVAKRMMIHSNPQVRWEAFKAFKPENTDEVEEVFDHFVKERHETVKKQAALILLETNDEDVISRLFKFSQGGFFRRRFLQQLVELCGNVRSELSIAYLSKIFHKRGIFRTSRQDRLRSAAITSLARLQKKAAIEVVNSALQDKSKRVRETAKLLLELKEEPQGS